VSAHAFLELRGEALDPTVHGRVIDLDPAIGQHALKVAVADRELQVPAHHPKDDLGREAEAAERPGVPAGESGWGALGKLDLEIVRTPAGRAGGRSDTVELGCGSPFRCDGSHNQVCGKER
jgi:hypothetical protein